MSQKQQQLPSVFGTPSAFGGAAAIASHPLQASFGSLSVSQPAPFGQVSGVNVPNATTTSSSNNGVGNTTSSSASSQNPFDLFN
jgi:hypothetical protein